MIARSVRLSRRTVDALIMSLALPVMLMLIFVYLFGGAMNTGGKYVTYVVPGVILLCVGFASAQTAVSVSTDMKNGVIDRFRSMNIGAGAILTGMLIPRSSSSIDLPVPSSRAAASWGRMCVS